MLPGFACGIRTGQAAGGGGAPVDFAFTASGTAAVSNPTFSARAIGAADASRYVLVSIAANASNGTAQNMTAVTVQGIAASRLIGFVNPGVSDARKSEIWMAAVPTGTTGDVVVTTGHNRVTIAVYRAVGLLSTTPTATGGEGSAAAGLKTATLNVLNGGFIVVCGQRQSTSAHTLSNVTNDYNASSGTVHYGSHGSLLSLSDQTVSSVMSDPGTAAGSIAAVSMR